MDWHSLIIIPVGMAAVFILLAWNSLRSSPEWEIYGVTISGAKRTVLLFAMPPIALLLFLSLISFRQYQNPHLAAGPYSWPVGCPPRHYKQFDPIPIACAIEANALPQKFTHEHGFHAGYRGSWTFYRIGNDAVALTCPFSLSRCTVQRIYRDVFVVTGKKTDPRAQS